MADELIIRTPDGAFRVSTDDLEPFRIEDEDPEVSGHDFGSFSMIVLKPGEDLGSLTIQPEAGGDDLFSGRLIGETEKNLGTRPSRGGGLLGGF